MFKVESKAIKQKQNIEELEQKMNSTAKELDTFRAEMRVCNQLACFVIFAVVIVLYTAGIGQKVTVMFSKNLLVFILGSGVNILICYYDNTMQQYY